MHAPFSRTRPQKHSGPGRGPQTHNAAALPTLRPAPDLLQHARMRGGFVPHEQQAIQRMVGNRAAGRLQAPLQPSLLLGPVDTPAEREAERISTDVVASIHAPEAATEGDARPPRLTPAAVVQRAGGVAGGQSEIDPAIAGSIEQARGRGQSLDAGVRAGMEQQFGHDFSGVRIHTDDSAHELAQSLQAQAFTTGSDIFFGKGMYRPEAPGGQRLLAHELTHVVQQSGSVQRQAVVQRAVGFEFEVGNWTLEKLNAPPSKKQKEGKEPIPDDQINPNGLSKKSVIYKGNGWAMMADTGDDMHIEFVTDSPGFPETDAGRDQLQDSMLEMRDFCNTLISEGAKAQLKRSHGVQVKKFFGTKTKQVPEQHPWMLSDDLPVSAIMTNVLIKPLTTMNAEPQTSAGIRIDQLATVLQHMSPKQQGGESKEAKEARLKGEFYLGGKKAEDMKLLGESPEAVRAAHAKHVLAAKAKGVNIPAASEGLIGLISLIRSYLVTASKSFAYAKSIAPLMARTDLGAIFDQLPDDEKNYFRGRPHVFGNIALDAAGMPGTQDEALFSGQTIYMNEDDLQALRDALSRGEWLESITKGAGHDLLTEDNFPDEDVANLLFGLGGLGSKMDLVGEQGVKKGKAYDNRTQAPVFEFRRMAGSQPHRVWPALAVDIFDYIRQINNKGDAPIDVEWTEKAWKNK